MKPCIFCQKEFIPKTRKAIYCSNKCRTYANRSNKELNIEDIVWIIDKNGVKRKLNPSDIEILHDKMCKKIGIIFENKKIIQNIEDKPQESIKSNEIIDYQTHFNQCEFEDEYRNLWEMINSDPNLNEKDKNLWKIRLNAK
jgi:hypothetical protein